MIALERAIKMIALEKKTNALEAVHKASQRLTDIMSEVKEPFRGEHTGSLEPTVHCSTGISWQRLESQFSLSRQDARMALGLTKARFQTLCLRMGVGYTWPGPRQRPEPMPRGHYTILTSAQKLDIIRRYESPPDGISQAKLAVTFKVPFRWHLTFNAF